jgi:pilus assembly protein CpaC
LGQVEPPTVQPPEKLNPPKAPETLPVPKQLGPFGPNQFRLPRLGESPSGLGRTPQPTAKDIEEYNRFVEAVIDPRNLIELVQGRVRLFMLKESPKRVQLVEPTVADYQIVGAKAKQLSLIGRSVGTTVLNVWFDDPADKTKERVLSFLVRVVPDPEDRERVENVYKALEKEINCAFPDSVVHLRLVGDKLVVSGQARDIVEATQILRIVRANSPGEDPRSRGREGRGAMDASKIPVGPTGVTRPGDPGAAEGIPGLEDFMVAGGPNVVNLLRVPGQHQVMLKVTVAEVNRTAARSIGVNFSVTNNSGVNVFQNRTGNIAGNTTAGNGAFNAVSNLANATTGIITNNLPVALDNGQISLAINALRNLNYARTLAEPNLVALNGQTANFQAGGQFPVPVVTGYTAAGLQGVNFVPYGVQLSFTPTVTDKDRIRLNVNAVVSTRDVSSGTNVNGSFVSGLNSRNFQTTVELREGQTMAVAGLIQNNLGADSSRIPLIGDLPVLSRLTGFDRTSMGEQELVVLITPELVQPMDCKQVPPLPGSDIFEPGDLEFYLLGRLESRRNYDYRSPVMTDVARMRRYHRCEQIYLFGPTGVTPER